MGEVDVLGFWVFGNTRGNLPHSFEQQSVRDEFVPIFFEDLQLRVE